MLKKIMLAAAMLVVLTASQCERDPNTASRNISQATGMFEAQRRIGFLNGITGGILNQAARTH